MKFVAIASSLGPRGAKAFAGRPDNPAGWERLQWPPAGIFVTTVVSPGSSLGDHEPLKLLKVSEKVVSTDAALRARNSASRYVLVREPLAHIDMLGKNVSIPPKPDGIFRSPSALQRPFDDIDVQAGRNIGSQECYRLIIRCDAPRSPTHDEARRVEKRAQVVFVLVAA
jgi:hypothetical protein